jgi:long-chain acyl-CoA synthetase
MYAAQYATAHPDRAAFIMAATGETVSYAELEARSNRLAHLLRAHGLKRLDHYSIFMENNNRYLESCGAGERAGLYYTCVNSYLKAEELAYILNNSESKALITSASRRDVALEALKHCPNVTLCLIVDGSGDDGPFRDYTRAVSAFPGTPIADEWLGTPMLYSSGTTGRPKGIVRPLPENPPSKPLPLFDFLNKLWHYRADMVYLSPAPLYHSAPQAAVSLTIRNGGTVIIMEHFDPEQYLALIPRYKVSHSQLVPTMFSRMLKLPEDVRKRYDLSSLEIAIHAAAPCPAQVKEQMIAWWGPIIHEYYGATEGPGLHRLRQRGMAGAPGQVGRVLLGDLHILDEDMQPCPKGAGRDLVQDRHTVRILQRPGAHRGVPLGRRHDEHRGRRRLRRRRRLPVPHRPLHVHDHLGRREHLPAGVREPADHPSEGDADAAVFGVPNEDLGEEVKAVIQPAPGVVAGPGAGRGTDRLLQRAPVAPEGAALGRLHRRDAAPADRQALQEGAARQVLGRQEEPHRLMRARGGGARP